MQDDTANKETSSARQTALALGAALLLSASAGSAAAESPGFVFSGTALSMGGRVSAAISAEFRVDDRDGKAQFHVDGPAFAIRAETGSDMKPLRGSYEVRSPELAKLLGFSSRTHELDPSGHAYVIRYMLNGKTVKTVSISSDGDFVDTDTIAFSLRKRPDDRPFNADLIIWNRGLRLSAVFQPLSGYSLASDTSVPPPLRGRLKDALVWKINLTGLVGVFYTHSIYVACSSDQTRSFIGTWSTDAETGDTIFPLP